MCYHGDTTFRPLRVDSVCATKEARQHGRQEWTLCGVCAEQHNGLRLQVARDLQLLGSDQIPLLFLAHGQRPQVAGPSIS